MAAGSRPRWEVRVEGARAARVYDEALAHAIFVACITASARGLDLTLVRCEYVMGRGDEETLIAEWGEPDE